MTRRLRVIASVVLAAGLLAGSGMFFSQRAKDAEAVHYDVRGVVRGVDTNAGYLRVEHETIPGYMEAMTMSLPVKPHSLLNGLEAGQPITFRLEVTSEDSWVSRIEKLAGPARGSSGVAEGDWAAALRVEPGEKVPDFTVIDQDGRARSLSDFRGKSIVVSFIYTRCPLPNFCPLLSKKLAELQQALRTRVPGKFHLLSITIDPAHDTPEVLKRYASAWTRDESTWSFGTAANDELASVARSLGLTYQPSAGGQIDHDLRTALIDPRGRLVHVWKSNFWRTEEVLQRIVEL